MDACDILDELVFALLGYSGEYTEYRDEPIDQDNQQPNGSFHLTAQGRKALLDLQNIKYYESTRPCSIPEQSLIRGVDRILALGTICKTLDQLCIHVCYEQPTSLYLCALGESIQRFLLVYKQDVCDIELQVRKRFIHTPLEVDVALELWHVILPRLLGLLHAVTDQLRQHQSASLKSAGGAAIVVNLVREAALSFPQSVSPCFIQILQDIHAVLHRQLSAWLRGSTLVDPYAEFFIQIKDKDKNKGKEKQNDDDNQCFIIGCDQYQLLETYVPSMLPMDAAKDILTTGTYINILSSLGQVPSFDQLAALDTRLQVLTTDSLDCEPMVVSVVSEYRKLCAHMLHGFFQGDAIVTFSRLFRDVLFHGRGDIWESFLDETKNSRGPRKPSLEDDLNDSMRNALFNLGMQDTEYGNFASLNVDRSQQSGDVYSFGMPEEWKHVQLYPKLDYKMSLLISRSLAAKWSRVFVLLLALKHAQRELNSLWFSCERFNQSSKRKNSLSSMYLLRFKMSLFVQSITSYCQTDVISVEHQVLIDRIKQSDDFENLQSSFEKFIHSVFGKCLLSSAMASNMIQETLVLCHKLCMLGNELVLSSTSSSSSSPNLPGQMKSNELVDRQVSELASKFIALQDLLHDFLLRARGSQTAGSPGALSLASLLSRLPLGFRSEPE